MLWHVVKPGPDMERRSLSQSCFKRWGARQGVGGEASNLDAKGRKARVKETKKSKLAEEA